MNKTFSNSSQLKCVFTDDGVTFCNPTQEVYFPYGCIDYIKISLLGVLQAASHVRICSFAVDRKDRGEAKEAVKFAQEKMKTAPKDEPRVVTFPRRQKMSLFPPSFLSKNSSSSTRCSL